MMEFIPRCNDLQCRQQLHDQAIVTTCSHIFCPQCAETTGLSRATVAQRTCPACNAPLHDQDDVVMTSLNPSEEYKTTLLSGLSPTVIMECASRGLAFHSYQTSQEIIYQEHLSRGLTDKYNLLSQQMDQLIHDANAQIKGLQEKTQAIQTEYAALEAKNHELTNAFKDKSRSQQHTQKLYQALKAQVMASHVASAAGDEAELALQTARGDRFIDRIPGTRMGSASYGANGNQMGGRKHGRADSRSSGDGGHLRAGSGIVGPSFAAHLQRRGIGARIGSNAKQPASAGTPSRLPVLGGTRQTQHGNLNIGRSYQASPVVRQNVEAGIGRSLDSFSVGGSARMSGGAGGMPLGR